MSIEDIFFECKERATSEGALTQEEWNDIVDEVLEEKRGNGQINDDEDVVAIREALQGRYEEFEEEIPEM